MPTASPWARPCLRCKAPFDVPSAFRLNSGPAYCPDCMARMRDAVRSSPQGYVSCKAFSAFVDGGEVPKDDTLVPRTYSGIAEGEDHARRLCGVCGSAGVESGYGHTPYGLGCYNFCLECHSYLDFSPDGEE